MVLAEVTRAVVDAETKVEHAATATTTMPTEDLEVIPIDELGSSTAKALHTEKAAALACAEARKVLQLKQKESSGKDASPACAAELSKLTSRLGNAAQELQKHRKIMLAAEKTWKQRQLLHDKEEELKQVEAEIERVEIM